MEASRQKVVKNLASRATRGFTLVEVACALAILGVLLIALAAHLPWIMETWHHWRSVETCIGDFFSCRGA